MKMISDSKICEVSCKTRFEIRIDDINDAAGVVGQIPDLGELC